MKAARALKITPEWIMNGETKQATSAADRQFIDWVTENLPYLSEEEREDIETLIQHAKERRAILEKYK